MDGLAPPRALSIAGSDSGGGAGIQADLKAFAACRVHGMTAITAITAQNTVGVTEVHQVPPATIVAQVRAVVDDIGVDAVKIGMLGTVETVDAVLEALDLLGPTVPVVIDPVMVSESGAILLDHDARLRLVSRLLPRATVVTPNIPEARAIAELAATGGPGRGDGQPAVDDGEPAVGDADPARDDVERLARAIHRLGPRTVVVTGGHRDSAVDIFFDGSTLVEIPGERFMDGAAHGSGCTHSSVLAARLAWGDTPLEAAREAKRLASLAVANGIRGIGAGAGPVDVLGISARR
jgi:hydroxymethylpyrimidine/phosphomethylpyrimidine kinase